LYDIVADVSRPWQKSARLQYLCLNCRSAVGAVSDRAFFTKKGIGRLEEKRAVRDRAYSQSSTADLCRFLLNWN
jgi:hypothetical protein